MRQRLPATVCMILLGLWGAGFVHAAVAVIAVDHLDATFVLPLAQSLLSPEGRVSFDQRTHALVVVDRPDAIDRVRHMLARLDRSTPQLLVRVRTRRPGELQRRLIGVSGQVSVPSGSVSVGGGAPDDGLQMALNERGLSVSTDGEQLIRVASGSAAIITLGEDVPARARRSEKCGAGQDCLSTGEYHRVASSLEVTPELRGDQVVMRVATVAAGAQADATGVRRQSAVHTELRLPLGQWVEVGAVLAEAGNDMAAILEHSNGQENTQEGFWLRVDRAEP
ncbi:MAG: secretin N-terminal domain-containing protein [Pseudomonadota bacterium]